MIGNENGISFINFVLMNVGYNIDLVAKNVN